jgi:tetratricopeptide (TPR) repeat protein
MAVVLWLKGRRLDRARVLQIFPFAAAGAAMGLVSIWWERHHQGTVGAQFAPPLPERVLIAGRALWFYAGKLLWPARLTFSYPRWSMSAGDPRHYVWLVASVAAFAALGLRARRGQRGAFLAALFFLAVLSPVLGVIPLYTFRYTFVADHYQYLACAGLLALLASALARALAARPAVYRAVAAAWLAALGLITFRQAGVYRNMEALWIDTLKKNPESWMAYDGLGAEYLRKQRWPEAFSLLSKAAELNPADADAYSDLGAVFYFQQRPQEAIPYFQKALKLAPADPRVHNNLAGALYLTGHLKEAVAQYEETLRLAPGYGQARQNLDLILAQSPKAKP